jgi:hypothetical protein
MIQVWINKDETANAAALTEKLNALITEKSGTANLGDKTQRVLRGFLIFADPARQADAEKVAADKKPEKIAVAYITAEKKAQSDPYKLNAEGKNTVYLISGKKVMAKFVDLAAADFDKVTKAAADLK